MPHREDVEDARHVGCPGGARRARRARWAALGRAELRGRARHRGFSEEGVSLCALTMPRVFAVLRGVRSPVQEVPTLGSMSV